LKWGEGAEATNEKGQQECVRQEWVTRETFQGGVGGGCGTGGRKSEIDET